MPSSSTRPLSVRSSPANKLSSVDLPTPDSPITARYSPGRTVRSTPSKIAGRSFEKRLLKFSSRTMGSVTPLALSGVDSNHRLDLQEVAQSELAPLAAVAGHFESAIRRVHASGCPVYSDLAGADACADTARM